MIKLTKENFDQHKTGIPAVGKNWIKVGMSTCGIAAGADEVYKTFVEEAKKKNLTVDIKKCGCLGMCYAEPLVEVHVEGVPQVIYGKVNKDIAIKILEKHVGTKMLVNDYIFDLSLTMKKVGK
ncbi:MAG: (2Fe-2S) ferredoxin domain-containing protein [bacterium]|jgi:(2Fe-2S) ferredoxin|nr:(2Fe-2S) ferredoxin domain-containing protein [bacterium]